MEKKLVKEVKIGNFDGVAEIYNVNGKYYSVEYKGKEEYYTKDAKLAHSVAGVILFFNKNLKLGTEVFSKQATDEEKWKALLTFLNKEAKDNEAARDVCMGIYKSLESYYYDSVDKKDDPALNIRSTIRSKDNLMMAIHRVAATKDPTEALKNFIRYQKSRNQFVTDKKIELELL